MAEPFMIIGGVGSILQIISSVTKLAKSLNEVRESYNNVALNTTLVASQLSTIRAALEALHAWRASDTVETEATIQLDKDLGLSLSCCAILITVIDGKLTESGYTPGMKMKSKIKYVWLEDILKEYVSNLEGQVRALQLLLTIFQCRTATEQKQQLANMESRGIIEQVRAETMTLGVGETEMDDAMSILSHDPSVHLDVESILMRSPAYKRVYGSEKQEPQRRKKLSGKPPPPPPRRKPAPQPALSTQPSSQTLPLPSETMPLPPQEPSPPPPLREAVPLPPPKDEAPLPPHHTTPLPSPQKSVLSLSPTKNEPQDTTPPSEIAPQPPPIPPRPKPRTQASIQRAQDQDEGQQQSEGRMYVSRPSTFCDKEEASDSGTTVMTDHDPMFEVPAGVMLVPEKRVIKEPLTRMARSDPKLGSEAQANLAPESENFAKVPNVTQKSDLVAMEPNFGIPQQRHSLEPPPIYFYQKKRPTGVSGDVTGEDLKKGRAISIEPSPSLAGFRYQLDMAFEEKAPPGAGDEGLGLSFTSNESRGTPPPQNTEDIILPPMGHSHPPEVESTSIDAKDQANREVPRETLSIHSSVDLYDASVKDVPTEDVSYKSPSDAISEDDATKSAQVNGNGDDLAAEMEGLSVLNQRLASKSSDERREDASAPTEVTVEDVPSNEPEDASKLDGTSRADPDSTATSLKPILSPQITMTPSTDADESQATHTPPQPVMDSLPTSPTRAPPLPPIRTVSIPPIPYTSPSLSSQAARNSAVETSTASSGRDSSVFEASSTVSSSEQSVDNTIFTQQQSTANTAATSVTIDGAGSARGQAQADLRRLQSELTSAKARGDSKAAQKSLQESIEVVRSTYLAASAPAETKKSRSPRLGARASLIRFPSMPGSAKASALGDAAESGDLETVRSLLDIKVNVDARSDNYKTPLMRAAMYGHLHCMEVLKQRGADEFAVDSLGRTVLHLAVVSNRLPAVKWLLDTYPPPRPDQLKHRGSILFKATESIINRSPKNLRETSDAEGSKPLHVAVGVDQGGIMKTLLLAGVQIEAKNNWGRTPLHQAIISGRTDCFDILLEQGADVNVADARGMTPLHWAAKTGHVDIIATLLGKGADRYLYDLEGNQPMHQAAWVGQVLVIETIITDRKDLEHKTKHGETMMHIACVNKNQQLAAYLLSNGADVNVEAAPRPSLTNALSNFKVIGTSMTPLHYACCKGDYEMVLLLLDSNAWINAPTPQGATALMMAAESEDTNIVNLLLNRGAKVNASMSGTLTTALHIAARRGDLETIQQLCRAGANENARNDGGSYGRTPSEEAEKYCTDNTKRQAVLVYFRTIRNNKRINARVQPTTTHYPNGMVGRANSTIPSNQIRPQQPVSYVPWGQSSLVPHGVFPGLQTQAQPTYQQHWPATYPQLIERAQSQPQGQTLQEWYDPNPLTHVESPPPYQAGPSVSARLANQAPVYRPGDPPGNGYA